MAGIYKKKKAQVTAESAHTVTVRDKQGKEQLLSKRDIGQQPRGSKSPEKASEPKNEKTTNENAKTNQQPDKSKTNKTKINKLPREFRRLKMQTTNQPQIQRTKWKRRTQKSQDPERSHKSYNHMGRAHNIGRTTELRDGKQFHKEFNKGKSATKLLRPTSHKLFGWCRGQAASTTLVSCRRGIGTADGLDGWLLFFVDYLPQVTS